MPAAGKMYIQDKVEEYADEVFDLLDKGVSLLLASSEIFSIVVSSIASDKFLMLVREGFGLLAVRLLG